MRRLSQILRSYTIEMQVQHASEQARVLHRTEGVGEARQKLLALIESLLRAGVEELEVRDDVPVRELAQWAVHCVGVAALSPSRAAALRAMRLTIDGLTATGCASSGDEKQW